MVIDTSALIAIFGNEPERARFLKLLTRDQEKLFSAASAVETGIVLEARGGLAEAREFDLFLYESGIEVVAVDSVQADRARMAYRKFAKGCHPAARNFADCFTHALAAVSGEPVLATGTEFSKAGLPVLT